MAGVHQSFADSEYWQHKHTASHSSEVALAFCGDFVSSTLAQSGFALLVWPAFS